jgi:FMN phosphatase YigB (HAD superfamily)
MPQKPVRAIVFDFGNVVGFFDHRLTSSRLAAHAGIDAEAIHAYLFGGPLEEDFESGRLASADFLQQVRQTCKLTCSEEVLTAAWADIFHPNETVCALLPGLHRHYRLLLGSNTNELHSRHFRRQFAEILRHFDALVLSHEIGVRKPRAGFFEHCRLLAGCAAEECLFIDDVAANVAGAQACGWHGIVYTGSDELRRQLAALGVLGLEV